MRTLFKQLKFNRTVEGNNWTQKTEWRSFIPGINSGVYLPASICINVKIKETRAGFFSFRQSAIYSNITLTPQEFDELYEEMTKIKNLRDENSGSK